MTKQEFTALLQSRALLLDGATGSNLMQRGMPRGVCTELWVRDNPDILLQLQREYVAAGSQVIYASSFSANPLNMEEKGLDKEQTKKLNRDLVELSRRAAGDRALVAGDMTTMGKPLEPYGTLSFTRAYDAYCLQAEALYQAGADLLVIETMMGVEETVAAAEAARSACDLPVLCSFSAASDGKCYFDGNVLEGAATLEALAVDAVGINCGSGPDQLLALVQQLQTATSLPLLVKPNAGLPEITPEGQALYRLPPEDFARQMQPLLQAGARLVGGCCGTTPEHIRALAQVL